MPTSDKKHKFILTVEELDKVQQRISQSKKLELSNEREKEIWTQEYLAKQANVSLSVAKRFLNRKTPMGESSFRALTQVLGFQPNEFSALQSLKDVDNKIFNWHKVCCDRLDHWKKRNVDLVIGDNRLDFGNIDRTFVPLDFLEKVKKESSQSKNTSKQQTEEYKSTQRYERQQDFLDVIIRDGLLEGSSKKYGQRLAIIGEAGSGKTTLLLQIGYELLKQPNNLVIWISLKEVRDKLEYLREYIIDEWLKGSNIAKNEWEQEFDNKLKDGCVWLLLDGLEDIPDKAHIVIGQFDVWLSKPKIALTCRKNRWDSDKADFASFGYGIYECVGYNSDQPSNFIDAWFGDDSDSANLLKTELQKANRHRINELIKYPLHLSLLCSIYEESESNFAFATNKAELFDQFIKRQYTRKITVDRFDADLVKSLGELAIKAIDTQSQLTNAEVKEKLGDRLDKALELGWLKPIDEYEQVYDFLHDSFKEYFAALAIDAWDFFLPRDHIDKPVKEKCYRIFEPVWNPVVLLWSGISRNPNTNNQSSLLIEKLIVFDDGCAKSNDYNNLGHFIALDIAFESNNIVLFDNILDQIIEWAFGTFNQYSKKREWYSISELAL
ncbi:NACHT domain-containing protein [Pseudanabaena sp. ABRG5-3]|uniref:NACHT domain-containing protein n=1 Tax=Pseudanabaena sp. ABRG5-3 TaxID=685565 RepID=UPI000DC6E859|nr:NACHT domain-containing protein [Pseudanabaena sp. ABRG5-3]BBC26958.1 signal transduction protein with Nacht domain [Pseudanabaena sp. ABRG5-3]